MSAIRLGLIWGVVILMVRATRAAHAGEPQLYGNLMTAVTESAAQERLKILIGDVMIRGEAGIEARMRLGRVLLDLELPQLALAPLRDALDLKPGNAEIAAVFSVALLAAGQGEQALLLANRIAADQPSDPARWRFLAEMRFRSGDQAGALAAAGRVLLLVPGDADATLVCAEIFAAQGKGALARRLFREVAPRVSDRAALEFAWGRLTLREDGWQEAVDHFTAGLELRGDAAALNDRGVAWARLGRFDRSEQDFRAALAMRPLPATRLNLANILIDRGDGPAAAKLAPNRGEVEPGAYWIAAGRYYALDVSSAASRSAVLASFEHASAFVDAERLISMDRARATLARLPPPKNLGKPAQPFAPEETMQK